MGKVYVKDSGVWRESSRIYVKDSSVWRPIKNVYVKQGGAWRLAYGGNVGASVTYEPTSFIGTISGNTLTVSGIRSGTIALDSYLNGTWYMNSSTGQMALITPGAKITAQVSGTTGGVGTYTLNTSFTSPTGNTLAIMSADVDMPIVSGYITNNVLTVVSVTQGTLYPGMVITVDKIEDVIGPKVGNISVSSSLPFNTTIVSQLTGTPGGVGTYSVAAYFNSNGYNYTLWNTNTAGKQQITIQGIGGAGNNYTFYAGAGGIAKQITIPQGVYSASVTLCGGSGGGGGSGGENNTTNYGGGGGGGANLVTGTLSVKPGEVYTVVAGSYGRAAAGYARSGALWAGDGGNSFIIDSNGSTVVSAVGGQGGAHSSHHDWNSSPAGRGGDGGSGANSGETAAAKSTTPAGGTSTNGGRNGGNGQTGMNDINPPSNTITRPAPGFPGFVTLTWN